MVMGRYLVLGDPSSNSVFAWDTISLMDAERAGIEAAKREPAKYAPRQALRVEESHINWGFKECFTLSDRHNFVLELSFLRSWIL